MSRIRALPIQHILNTVALLAFLSSNIVICHAEAGVPKEYIGHWKGIICKGGVQQRGRIGPTIVNKDIGHDVREFEFDITSDGTVRGHGVATYWFDISAPTNLLITSLNPEAHLEGKIRKINFTIGGIVQNEGIQLWLTNPQRLPLINAGKKSSIESWNVFSSNTAKLTRDKDSLYLGWSGIIEGFGMKLEWKAIKAGLVIYDIATPSPNNSFISTDELKFMARVEGSPQLDYSINWKSEDGKVSNIESGKLKPPDLQSNPDYPKTPPLRPDPPPAPNGRGGELSYKITARLEEEPKQETAVIIQQDELDQLRQEYVDMKKNRVPQRGEFTQNGGQFNTGDYIWAIVRQVVIDGYHTIVEVFAPNVTRLNSAYRNPVHNARLSGSAPGSRHIYGDALDFQTPSIGHAGPPNKDDWDMLVDAVRMASPSFIEGFRQSGAGHVHVDWRP